MARARPPTLPSALKASLPSSATLLLAVSGGADSMALLHATARLADTMQLSLVIGHIDHALRADSAQDAAFVETQAAKLALKFRTARLSSAPESNIEAWARKERYSALRQLAEQSGCEWIVTAHTAQDVAETLLMRLVANKELGTIAPKDRQRILIRPMLTVTRDEVHAYVGRHGIEFVEDQSNFDLRFLRNRIRQRVLPTFVNEFGVDVVRTLAMQAEGQARDARALRIIARKHISPLSALSFGSREWLRALQEALREQPKSLRVKIIEEAFLAAVTFPLGRRHGLRLLRFIETGRVAVQLPAGITVRRFEGGIVVQRRT